MVRAIARELVLQQPYLAGQTITSVYFGGGTPSLLDEEALRLLLDTIYEQYTLSSDPEITLEANPDDLSLDKLQLLQQLGFNRLSIGIQSFYEPHLRYLNRAHSTEEAKRCVQRAQEVGFNNLSIDLIYAIPHPDHSVWQADLATAISLNPQHISAYCLTIEEKTVFGRWLRHQKIPPIDETFAANQFEQLVSGLASAGYEQYEVSNFCQPSWESKHNSNYWKDVLYLGVGPSAHSFNGNSRQYNVANNSKYLNALAESQVPYEWEELTQADRINEYLMTRLRTKWGCDLAWLKQELNYDLAVVQADYIEGLIRNGKAMLENRQLVLTSAGKLLADGIAADFFVDSE